MREYFIMVSQGVEKTKLFAANMANTLIENVYLGNILLILLSFNSYVIFSFSLIRTQHSRRK